MASKVFIVPVCDAEAIATAVRALADNPELRRTMSANALLRAAEHTVEVLWGTASRCAFRATSVEACGSLPGG